MVVPSSIPSRSEAFVVFESCCTPVDIAHLLRRRYSLPAEPAVGHVTLVTGADLGAVDMRADVGASVLSLLQEQAALPVIADPRNRTWTFLVDVSRSRAGELGPSHGTQFLEVSVRALGSRVFLPMTDTGSGWRWVREPLPGRLRLPALSEVLDAVAGIDAWSRTAG